MSERKTIRFHNWEKVERRAAAADEKPYTFVRLVAEGELGADSPRTEHWICQLALEMRRIRKRLEEDPEYEIEHVAFGQFLDRCREALAQAGAYTETEMRDRITQGVPGAREVPGGSHLDHEVST